MENNPDLSGLDSSESGGETEFKRGSSFSSSIIKKIVFALIGFFVLSGGAFGAWYGYQEYFTKPDLSSLFISSFETISNAKTMRIDYELEIEGKEREEGSSEGSFGLPIDILGGADSRTMKLSAYSLIDANDEEKVISENKINLSGALSLGLHIINNNENIYLQVTEIPALLAMFVQPEMVSNRWINIDLEKQSEFLDTYKDKYLPEEEDSDIETYTKNLETAMEGKNIIIETSECQGKEEISCEFKVDPDELRLFMTEFFELSGEKMSKQAEEIDEKEWESYSEYLRMFSFSVTFDKEKEIMSSFSGFFSDNENKLEDNQIENLAFKITLSQIDEAVNINIPEASITIEELIGEIMAGFMGGVTTEDDFDDNSFDEIGMEMDYGEEVNEKKNSLSCNNDVWICDQAMVCPSDLGDGDYIVVAQKDISDKKQWKNRFQSECDSPQCEKGGEANEVNLVADNTVDFSLYPARDACKKIGGRLPTINELNCIYSNRNILGDNYVMSVDYWSSTKTTKDMARTVHFNPVNNGIGISVSNKLTEYNVRCVVGSQFREDVYDSEEEMLRNLDSDGDGLSDWDEITIYGTDPYNPDTDADGYLDGDEVKNGFNPRGPGLLDLPEEGGIVY